MEGGDGGRDIYGGRLGGSEVCMLSGLWFTGFQCRSCYLVGGMAFLELHCEFVCEFVAI